MELTLATLVILGVALMILETVIPGWIAGILGGLCVLSAAAAVLLSDSFDTWPSWGRTLLAGGVVLFSVLIMVLWMRLFGARLMRSTLTLNAAIPAQPPTELMPEGTVGVAITELRPLGRAEFSGTRREVRCEDGFAPAGSQVRVSGAEPGNLLVRLILPTPTATS